MNNSDKKYMTWIVFVTILLGILAIVFFKPEEIGASAFVDFEDSEFALPEEFDEFFEEPEGVMEHTSFINKKNKPD